MARSSLGVPAGVLGLALSLLLTGCYGAYQVEADRPSGAGALTPSVEDKDAGLVGIAGGLESELVRRLRESGLFGRVVNLTETPWPPGAEKALRLDGRITRLGVRLSRGEAPRKE